MTNRYNVEHKNPNLPNSCDILNVCYIVKEIPTFELTNQIIKTICIFVTGGTSMYINVFFL